MTTGVDTPLGHVKVNLTTGEETPWPPPVAAEPPRSPTGIRIAVGHRSVAVSTTWLRPAAWRAAHDLGWLCPARGLRSEIAEHGRLTRRDDGQWRCEYRSTKGWYSTPTTLEQSHPERAEQWATEVVADTLAMEEQARREHEGSR